jgi:CRP-like cAMP-binding protein
MSTGLPTVSCARTLRHDLGLVDPSPRSTEEAMFDIASLGNVPLFEGLSQFDVRTLSEIAHERSCERGEELITRGQVVSNLYIIAEGRFALTILLSAGDKSRQTTIETKGAGETLGWSALVRQRTSIYSVYCVWPARIIEFRRGALEVLMNADGALGFRLLRNVAELVGDRATVLQNLWREEIEQHPDRVRHWLSKQSAF